MVIVRGVAILVLACVPVLGLAGNFDKRMSPCARETDPGLQIEVCTKLLESGTLKPGDLMWAYNNRAGAYLRMRFLLRAMQDISAALTVSPDFAPANYTMGQLWLVVGNYDAAIEAFGKALELLERQNGAPQTIFEFSEGKEIRTADMRVSVLLSRATALVMQERLNEAEKDSRAALAINPKDFRVYNNLGYIHLLRKNYSTAIGFYEKGLALAPADPKIRAGLKAARDAAKQR